VIGASLSLVALHQAAGTAVLLAAVTALTVVFGLAAAVVLTMVGRVDRATATLGMISGGSAAASRVPRTSSVSGPHQGTMLALVAPVAVAGTLGRAPRRMSEILPSHVRAFLRRLTVDGRSAMTVQRCKTVLSSIFTTALNDQCVAR
jgi:hypothetical protein